LTPPPTGTPSTFPTIAGDLGWGRIYGEVLDASTSLPIEGATVTCRHSSYTSPSTCNTSILSQSDGSYTFPEVFFHDTDRIWLEVKADGYAAQKVQVDFLAEPRLKTVFLLVPGTGTAGPPITCTAPSCGPYEALFCPSGDCPGGCGLMCATPAAICTPPLCAIGTNEVYTCPGICPGGCGTICATYTPEP
jgi:hypothetical protein